VHPVGGQEGEAGEDDREGAFRHPVPAPQNSTSRAGGRTAAAITPWYPQARKASTKKSAARSASRVFFSLANRIVNRRTSGHHCVPSVERWATWSVRIGEKAKSAPARRAAHSPAPSSFASQ